VDLGRLTSRDLGFEGFGVLSGNDVDAGGGGGGFGDALLGDIAAVDAKIAAENEKHADDSEEEEKPVDPRNLVSI
jgi:hypothetical protein